jgi:hypothetical protein
MMWHHKGTKPNEIMMFTAMFKAGNCDVHHLGTKINDIIMFIEMPRYRGL